MWDIFDVLDALGDGWSIVVGLDTKLVLTAWGEITLACPPKMEEVEDGYAVVFTLRQLIDTKEVSVEVKRDGFYDRSTLTVDEFDGRVTFCGVSHIDTPEELMWELCDSGVSGGDSSYESIADLLEGETDGALSYDG